MTGMNVKAVSGLFDVILVRHPKTGHRVTICLDDHSSEQYCSASSPYYISEYVRDFIEKSPDTYAIVEALPKAYALKYKLGYTSPHTQIMEQFIKLFPKVKRVDIRPVYQTVGLEQITPDMNREPLFRKPMALLDLGEDTCPILASLASFWSEHLQSSPHLIRHWRLLQRRWRGLYKESKWGSLGQSASPQYHYVAVPFGPWKTDQDLTLLRKYELLCDALVVFHVCVHVISKPTRNCLVHMGATHSIDLAEILRSQYGYVMLNETAYPIREGRVNMDSFSSVNCAYLPSL